VTFLLMKAQNLNFAMPIDLVSYRSGTKRNLDVKTSKPVQSVMNKEERKVASYENSSLMITTAEDEIGIGSIEEAERWFKMGVSYGKANMHREEINAYKKAIDLNHDHVNAHYNLGMAYSYLGIYREASASYNEVIRIKPYNPEAYYQLGVVSDILGSYDKAINSFEQAITIRPGFTAAIYDLGLTYLSAGKKDAALTQYNNLKDIDPTLSEKLFNRINQ
jgi:tetratricopeptide (TPR) repeat protein